MPPREPENNRCARALAMYAPEPATQNARQPRIVIQDWSPVERNTLRGWFTVIDNETGILLHECSLHLGEANDWIGLPCSPKVYDDQVVRKNGKVQYRHPIKIVPRQRWEQFQAAVLEALRQHPEAGRCWQ